MSRCTKHGPRVALTALGLGLVCTVSAAAQRAPTAMAGSPGPGLADAAAEAAALRAEATALFTSPKQWRRVAQLRLEAARVAPLDDRERVEDLWLAGNVLAYLGEPDAAQRHFEEAAATALAFGDIFRAAQGYLLASTAAARAGALESARALIARGDLLAHSPLMPQVLCDCLETRIAMLSGDVARMAGAIR